MFMFMLFFIYSLFTPNKFIPFSSVPFPYLPIPFSLILTEHLSMFHLPKQSAKPTTKNSDKSYTINHSEIRKKPNINQIKYEIELILKRSNNPLSINIQKQTQRSHRNIHHHLLQRKKSKILQRANQQNIEKAKNNRKIYEEYIMGDLAPKTYSKTIEPKENSHHFNFQQKSFSKQLQTDFSTSKTDFNSSRTLELLKKQKRAQSMFTNKEIQHLGLGKLLFYKDTNIKLKRSSLLDGRTSTDRRNLFKDTAMESFYHEPSLDITRYLKHLDKTTIEEDETKVKKSQPVLPRQRSLEIFRKDLIPKESFSHQITSPTNPQELGIMGIHKIYVQHSEKQAKRLTKFEISPHLKENGQETRQTLNVMDEQLLVYYGKMKNRKPSKDYLPSATHRTTIFSRSSKQKESTLSRFLNIGAKTSIEIKNPLTKENSQKFHHFDPWEKYKHEDEIDHQNAFGVESSLEVINMGQSSQINQNSD